MSQQFQNIKWVRQWGGSDVIVWISVKKLDRLWQPEEGYYVGREAKEEYASPRRYQNVRKWLETQTRRMHMPHVWPCDGYVSFTDGRHRFAWMRDHGVKAMPVTTGRAGRDALKTMCGTRIRICRLPLPIKLR